MTSDELIISFEDVAKQNPNSWLLGY